MKKRLLVIHVILLHAATALLTQHVDSIATQWAFTSAPGYNNRTTDAARLLAPASYRYTPAIYGMPVTDPAGVFYLATGREISNIQIRIEEEIYGPKRIPRGQTRNTKYANKKMTETQRCLI